MIPLRPVQYTSPFRSRPALSNDSLEPPLNETPPPPSRPLTPQATKPGTAAETGAGVKPADANQRPKADKRDVVASERKPLQHDEPTSDEWATGKLGRAAGALETKEWGDTFYTAPEK